MTENEKIKKSIEVFEKPSKHIKCVHKCENGMEFLTYSQYLVLAFETAIDGLKELEQYRSIGTVEECREAVERNKAKKPIKINWGVYDFSIGYECPRCREDIDEGDHHCRCGQAISWEESEGEDE